MLERWSWVVLFATGCASTAAKGARGSEPQQDAPPQSGAQDSSGTPGEVPVEVAAMLSDGPCEARVRAPLEQHVLREPNDGPSARPPLLIGPGEKLCLISDANGAVELVQGPVAVAEQQGRLISVEMAVLPIGTVLVVRNHFDRLLTYRAFIKGPSGEPEPTSICPVRPGLAGVEHWPKAAELIAVGDFRFLDPGAKAGCQ